MQATYSESAPRAKFVTGHLGEFRRDVLGFFERCARAHGDFVPLRFGPRRAFLVSDPAMIEALLTAGGGEFRKPFIEELLRPLLGDALFIAEGAAWRRQRRALQPTFSKERVGDYGQTVVDVAERVADGFRAGEVRDLHADMMRLSAAIDMRALFGVDIGGPAGVIAAAADAVAAYFERRMTSLVPVPLWVPTAGNRRVSRAIADADRFICELIATRRGQAEARSDVLSQLLQARDEHDAPLSDRQLRDEVLSLLVAGQETSAVALSWALHLLSQHPDADARLHDELRAVLGERAPTYHDLARLPFTEQVIQETLRLYPPFYFFGRDALADCKLGGHAIPAGATVFVSPWVLHRDPRFFHVPEAFVPERWNRDRPRPPKYAYFPFGGGARACIASAYVSMKLALSLATLARRFRFEAVPGRTAQPWPVVTLRPRQGVTLRLVAR